MQAEVHLCRRFGQRIANESSGPVLVGHLQFAYVMHGGHSVATLKLRAIDNTSDDGTIALLYEPVLTGLGSQWLCLRGYESVRAGGDMIGYVQEWRCRIT